MPRLPLPSPGSSFVTWKFYLAASSKGVPKSAQKAVYNTLANCSKTCRLSQMHLPLPNSLHKSQGYEVVESGSRNQGTALDGWSIGNLYIKLLDASMAHCAANGKPIDCLYSALMKLQSDSGILVCPPPQPQHMRLARKCWVSQSPQ